MNTIIIIISMQADRTTSEILVRNDFSIRARCKLDWQTMEHRRGITLSSSNIRQRQHFRHDQPQPMRAAGSSPAPRGYMSCTYSIITSQFLRRSCQIMYVLRPNGFTIQLEGLSRSTLTNWLLVNSQRG